MLHFGLGTFAAIVISEYVHHAFQNILANTAKEASNAASVFLDIRKDPKNIIHHKQAAVIKKTKELKNDKIQDQKVNLILNLLINCNINNRHNVFEKKFREHDFI